MQWGLTFNEEGEGTQIQYNMNKQMITDKEQCKGWWMEKCQKKGGG